MRWYRAVAVDLDGTLSTGGWPSVEVLDAVTATRRAGVRALLVTGRILAELDLEFPGLADQFDLIVGENGSVMRSGTGTRRLAEPADPALLDRLHSAGVSVRRGQVLLATTAEADHRVLDAIEALELDLHLVRNRNALMIMPAGVTKGTGLREGLAELGLSPHNTLAIGDAENDHALLATAEVGVAVANAVESLRRRADLVLTAPDGAGVAELLTGPVLAGEQRIHPPRWRVVLGTGPSGQVAAVPAAQTNLLISGGSDSGKSYLAGLFLEQILALGYTALVIDPEGDHVSLGALRNVTVLSGADLPDPNALLPYYQHTATSTVLDLSRLDPAHRDGYLHRLWPSLAIARTLSGLPHWVVIEEAQNHHWCRVTDSHTDLAAQWGLCLVTYQPQQVAPGLLTRMEWHAHLSPGGRTGILTRADQAPQPFTVGRRTTHHVRHWHKYVDTALPPHLMFTFRSDHHVDGPTAATLRQFLDRLHAVPEDVISFHARRGDFSRWVADVYRDHVLAALLDTTERDLVTHHDPERTRRLLIDLITTRYLDT